MDAAFRELNMHGADDLISAVGYGRVTPRQLFQALYPDEGTDLPRERKKSLNLDKLLQKIPGIKKDAVTIKGVDDLLVRYAKCCQPIIGDVIVGFITRGRGVTVHKADCPYVLESDPERRIELQWGKDALLSRLVKVKVICKNEKGILARMSSKISSEKVNIASARINTGTAKANCLFEVDVKSLSHLERVIGAIRKVKGVVSVERV